MTNTQDQSTRKKTRTNAPHMAASPGPPVDKEVRCTRADSASSSSGKPEKRRCMDPHLEIVFHRECCCYCDTRKGAFCGWLFDAFCHNWRFNIETISVFGSCSLPLQLFVAILGRFLSEQHGRTLINLAWNRHFLCMGFLMCFLEQLFLGWFQTYMTGIDIWPILQCPGGNIQRLFWGLPKLPLTE